MAIHKMKDENSNPTLDHLLPPSLLGNAILQPMAQLVKSESLKLLTYWLHLASKSASQLDWRCFCTLCQTQPLLPKFSPELSQTH